LGQIDEKELGISYEELDKILKDLETKEKSCIAQEKIEKVKRMINYSEHKRKFPKIFLKDERF